MKNFACSRVPAALAILGMISVSASHAAEIEEIIVTVQKREQSVQEVPIAISAFTEEDLRRGGIDNILRLDLVTPGMTVGFSGVEARIAIRGVRTEGVTNVTDPQITFFVDNLYKSRTSQAMASFVDVERVEVHRGPQGTLNGRNTFGGTIAVISNRPSETFDAGFNQTVGNYNLFRTEGFINIPVSDAFKIRLAGMAERRDGYIEDFSEELNPLGDGTTFAPSQNASDLGEIDRDFLRASFLWTTDKVEMLLRASYYDAGGTAPGINGHGALGTLAEPTVQPDGVTRLTDLNGVFVPGNTRRGSGNAADDRGPYDVARDIEPSLTQKETSISLDINWEINDAVAFRSITGYSDFETKQFEDSDYSPAPHAIFIREEPVVKTFTQEFQLLSTGDGPLEWVAGIYYMDDQTEQDTNFMRFTAVDPADPDMTIARPLADPFTLIPISPFARLAEVDTESIAVFADVNWKISDSFRLFGGVRWTEDDKSFVRYNSAMRDPDDDFSFVPIREPVLMADESFDEVTWRFGGQWDFADSQMTYAQVSTGFTSGGFNVTGPPSFDPQTITAYEVGLKGTYLDGTLQVNTSAYYNDMEDMLTQGFEDLGVTVISFLANAGAIEAKGLEVEVVAVPTDAWRITGLIAFMDAEFGDFRIGNPFVLGGDPSLPINAVNISGSQVALSPDLKLNLGASYTFNTNAGTFTPFLQIAYSDQYPTNDHNQIPNQDSYTKTDFRLMWASNDGSWTAEAYVENIEDEAVLVRTTVGSDDAIFGSYLPPRMYGLKFGYRYR